jgi:HD-like signal output (HDOD) protein
MDDEKVVVLARSQTGVNCRPSVMQEAIKAAFNITMSPHEHVWTTSQQKAMAAYGLWAHQRLCAIEQLTDGQLVHEEGLADDE